MRTLHFDCFSGLSGDMTLGALLDLGVPVEVLRKALDSLGLPITLEVERVKRCGLAATKATITAPDQEDYRFLPDIEAILAQGALTAAQRERALSIFRKLAEAEAKSHGMPIERVHFHEVGALDSIADIVGSAVGFDWLGIETFTCRSVVVGSGTVKCAHGIMPVPPPATAELLKGFPIAATTLKGEQTTPTGAAILAATVSAVVESPVMRVEAIGLGAGTRDPLDQPNVLRLFLGTAESTRATETTDTVVLLETNLDDAPGELIGYCMERLFAAGALDVFTVPIQMKKQRPGVILSVLAEPHLVVSLEGIIFRETGTFGIRKQTLSRSKLAREEVTVETPYGRLRAKRGRRGDHLITTPEYDDCAKAAREHGVPLRVVYDAVVRSTV